MHRAHYNLPVPWIFSAEDTRRRHALSPSKQLCVASLTAANEHGDGGVVAVMLM